ncbi:MAG: metabolite traffic protein EboE [Myxococcota bacterium]
MRLGLAGREVHLGYSTNVHAGDPVPVAARVRALLGVPRLGLGLWLPSGAARALRSSPGGVARLRERLEAHGLYVFTLNGFPFGDFHAERVKESVFCPDWTDPARLAYTLDLAHIAIELCDGEPTISTLPLGRRGVDVAACARTLRTLAQRLDELAQRSGRGVTVCLEPEPGCALESIAEAAAFLRDHRRLALCYDACHAAVAFEIDDGLPADAPLGKVQISAAIEVRNPSDATARDALAAFDEPRFLHQVRTARGDAALDLPEALARLPRDAPWRVHFHVPIHRDAAPPLGTTREALRRLLARLAVAGPTHFEVETYTWTVLPPADRPRGDEALAQGIAAEIRWARAALGA